MNTLKGIIIILISVLSGTSLALACAAHEPDFYEEPPVEPGIEDAVIKINSGEDDDLLIGSATLRVFLNEAQMYSDVAEFKVVLSNTDAMDTVVVRTLRVPNSGELVVDFDGVDDFYAGVWRVEITAINENGTYGYGSGQVEARLVTQSEEMRSSGCDIGAGGSTAWTSLMGIFLIGLMGLRRR